jgi:hypothetical protein
MSTCVFNNETGHWDCTKDPETWEELVTRMIGITVLCITMLGGFTFGICLIGAVVCTCVKSGRDVSDRLRGVEEGPVIIEFAPHSKTKRKVPVGSPV